MVSWVSLLTIMNTLKCTHSCVVLMVFSWVPHSWIPYSHGWSHSILMNPYEYSHVYTVMGSSHGTLMGSLIHEYLTSWLLSWYSYEPLWILSCVHSQGELSILSWMLSYMKSFLRKLLSLVFICTLMNTVMCTRPLLALHSHRCSHEYFTLIELLSWVLPWSLSWALSWELS